MTRLLDDFFKVDEAIVRYEREPGQLSEPVRMLRLDRGDSAAAVVVKLPERDLIMVEQFRYPTYDSGPGWLLELVAGSVDGDEAAEDAIRREIVEETGYLADRLEYITTFYVSPGGSTERISLFYAEVSDATRIHGGGGLASEGEHLATRHVPWADLAERVAAWQIPDAKTLIGLAWLRQRLASAADS